MSPMLEHRSPQMPKPSKSSFASSSMSPVPVSPISARMTAIWSATARSMPALAAVTLPFAAVTGDSLPFATARSFAQGWAPPPSLPNSTSSGPTIVPIALWLRLPAAEGLAAISSAAASVIEVKMRC